MDYLRLLRIKHWIKNSLVIMPLMFTMQAASMTQIIHVLMAALAFCFASSCAYIIDDIVDRDADRLATGKKNNPLVQGTVTVQAATLLAMLLFILALWIGHSVNMTLFWLLAAFVLLNLLYTLLLQHIPVLDVMTISSGFVIRLLAGYAALTIDYTPWMVLLVFFGGLLLAFGKRRSELDEPRGILNALFHRQTESWYTKSLLNGLLMMSAGLTILGYVMFVIDERTIAQVQTPHLFFTIPFVIFGIIRFVQQVRSHNAHGDVVNIVMTDAAFTINALLWCIATLAIAQHII